MLGEMDESGVRPDADHFPMLQHLFAVNDQIPPLGIPVAVNFCPSV